MTLQGKEIKIFTGNSVPELARGIVRELGLPLGQAEVSRFRDGEISVSIGETVRGTDVFLVQSTCSPVNDNIMELLIMIDAFKRASAGRINAVIPYMGYARQDRKAHARDPISAKLMADIITAAGADRVLTMDLHAQQIQGFFNIPVDHLVGVPLLVSYYAKKFSGREQEVVVVSPDLGSVTRARNFAERFNGAPIAIIDKRRPKANVSEVMNLIGEVKGKTAILVDDLVDTAGTLCNAAKAIMEHGACEVYACATHGVLSDPATERIENSVIRELTMLNTITLPEKAKGGKIVSLETAPYFAQAISRVYSEKPISPMF